MSNKVAATFNGGSGTPVFITVVGNPEPGGPVEVAPRAWEAIQPYLRAMGYRKVAPAEIPSVQTRDDLTAWMESEGWEKISAGQAGEMWEKDHRVAVPYAIKRGSHEWLAVLERLAL